MKSELGNLQNRKTFRAIFSLLVIQGVLILVAMALSGCNGHEASVLNDPNQATDSGTSGSAAVSAGP